MEVKFPLWCPECDRHAHFVPGIGSCVCGNPFDPGLPPGGQDAPPGEGIWRIREAVGSLPKEASLGEGSTPLETAEAEGVPVHLKLEHLSPTGSYKDRGAAYCLSLLASLGADSVTEDSSGNAGAAYAAYAAATGLRCQVFVPRGAPEAKTGAIRRYGAVLREAPEGRLEAQRRARSAPDYAGHAWAPPFLVGVGTLAWEVLEQAGGTAPPEIFLPVGQGGLLYALFLAYRRLCREGRIDSMPALTGVQAEGCAPLCLAARRGGGPLPEFEPKETSADAVAIPGPVRWRQVLRAVRETGGEWIAVTEEEILGARRSLAARGHDVEPASALPWAAVHRRASAPGGLRPGSLVPLTGSGWKLRGGKTP